MNSPGYEEASLLIKVVDVATKIPKAFRDLRDLLAGKGHRNDPALSKLEIVRQYIVSLSEAHEWLDEAKQWHQQLQNLDSAFEPIRREYANATDRGKLILQDFRIAEARKAWAAAKPHSLSQLVVFAGTIRYIEPSPLSINPDGTASGPAWACRLVEVRDRLDRLFKQHDANNLKAIPGIIEGLDEVTNLVKTTMHEADEKIRRTANEL
jgi:hypothetical protein